jgi:hypothetical protein
MMCRVELGNFRLTERIVILMCMGTDMVQNFQNAKIRRTCARGVNYSEKSVRRFLGLENPGNFSRDSGIFLPKFKGFCDFFQLIFSKYFPLFFFAELFATYNPSNNF